MKGKEDREGKKIGRIRGRKEEPLHRIREDGVQGDKRRAGQCLLKTREWREWDYYKLLK